ncbi:cell division protein FtsZ [Baekduia sp.]|jgi:cell division protein FtsZ|uniref:cell division protein FtsZ n=1 Tax=Baekduia sp. TaxID=2600305 RepID=UPI002E044651|nr:cell division protein FtsZ [Baekduia sp.]
MREGPLAALFRRTDEDAPEGAESTPQASAPEEKTTPQAASSAPPAEAIVPPATPAAARRREPDPLRDEGPAATTPPHPRETGYPHPSLGADPEPEATEASRAPSAQERLRNAFSSELPDDILAPGGRADSEPARARRAVAAPAPAPAADPYARSAPSYDESPWGAKVAGSPVIRVVGVGGAGVNAVNRMVEAEVQGVEFLAINTDLQSLQQSTADITLHIGPQVTRGLGAGSNPDLGRQAAMEEYDRIKSLMKGSDMVFIAAGSGGGTGTGAAPIVARIAREIGALTVGIVTKPFGFEGSRRAQQADVGIEALHAEVDTLIVVPNNRLLSVLDKHTSMVDAFRVADDVLRQGVQGVSDLVTLPGIINLDFADVRTIMSEAGAALLGIGMGVGDKRALEAAEQAVSSPLLETSMEGARSILLSITGGKDLSLWEVNEAAKAVAAAAHPDANIIFGAMVDEKLEDQVWVTVVATRYGNAPKRRSEPRIEEPKGTGEPRIERRTPSPVASQREPISVRRGGVVSDLDVPEFLPRR